MRLADALPRRPGREPYVVPYLLVDRRRAGRRKATIRALRDGGAAALELGFPFSDPIADGPILAAADQRALRAGTSWADLVAAVREAADWIPTAVMTYANPVWSRGLDRSLRELSDAGAGGLIVADLSWDDAGPWRRAAARARLDLVLFAAPGGSPARVARVARDAAGFLYLVSRYGTTGSGAAASPRALRPLVRAAHRARPELSVLVGFGVRDAESRDRALESGADGVVVGTALEEELGRGASPSAVERWIRSIVAPSPGGGRTRLPRTGLRPAHGRIRSSER